MNSIMQYNEDSHSGMITARNPYYNLVGFGKKEKMTGTDKIALNILFSCPFIKKNVFSEFLNEEIDRNYIELMQLNINPNNESKR